MSIIRRGLSDPCVRVGHRYSIWQRAQKICTTPATQKLHHNWTDFKDDFMSSVRESPKVRFETVHLFRLKINTLFEHCYLGRVLQQQIKQTFLLGHRKRYWVDICIKINVDNCCLFPRVKVTIEGKQISVPGAMTRWCTDETYSDGTGEVTFIKNVEDVALRNYAQNGYPQGE